MNTTISRFFLTCGFLYCAAAPLWAADGPETARVKAHFEHGPRKPSQIPILPGLNAGRSVFHGDPVKSSQSPDYAPTEGDSFAIHNGPGIYNHILTSGVWYLQVGDRPAMRMNFRGESGSYALPALLPGLGINGDTRLAVTVGGKTKWLDKFDSIDAVLSPGSAQWRCTDRELNVAVELAAVPFEDVFGFAATAKLIADRETDAVLTWSFNGTNGNKKVTLKPDYAEIDIQPNPGGYIVDKCKYTKVYVGLTDRGARVGKGRPGAGNGEVVVFDDNAEKPLALLESKTSLKPGQPVESRLVCVWGYKDYDRKAADEAYKRLRYKPFADPQWVEPMKKQWFHHWIGRGLQPEEKFLDVRAKSQKNIDLSTDFWNKQRGRLRIKTPDSRFDNAINNTAAVLRRQYEYPAFVHGVGWLKYGKISCGHFGCEAAGYHDEVADSLLFISGTQDMKGRMRYFEPVFTIASWCEEQDFYYVCHVWHHYCWTGDRAFLEKMWPSVLRAMEHGLAASDPDGDGLMTAYYEQWNCDGHGRGGRSAIWTGMAQAALQTMEKMANILGGQFMDQLNAPVEQYPRQREFAKHYAMLRARTQEKLKKELWNKEVGAYCSGEANGDLRPHPEAMEQSWFIWRGVGEPMDNYMAMRYIRENLHLHTTPDVTIELMNDWWPITWSNHYAANGDSAFSVLSACKSGDVDHFWPVLKTIAETTYKSSTATMWLGVANDGRAAGGMNQLIEVEPMVMLAAVEGLFGVEPQFGENLLVLRPNLPSRWDHAEITTADFSYAYEKDDAHASMKATTPLARRVRAELPVRGEVQNVLVNGQPAKYALESAVNACRVIVESPPGNEHRFEIKLAAPAAVDGKTRCIVERETRFSTTNAKIAAIHDPQKKMRSVAIVANGAEAVLTPEKVGKCTVFLELRAGESRWLHPLDLDVQRSWDVVERFISAKQAGGPSVASPKVDVERKTLVVEIRNNTQTALVETATATVAGKPHDVPVNVPPMAARPFSVDLTDVWDRLSPGSVPFQIELAGLRETGAAVNWQIGRQNPAMIADRSKPLDLRPYYNIELTHMYGQKFKWRHDYTGCGIGIDWRDPMPLRDKLGYVLPTTPIDQFEYQTLPEGVCGTAHFQPPNFTDRLETPFGVPFAVGRHPLAPGDRGNMLALASTEPYEQLPSTAVLQLEHPTRLEKLYLLTANLTKNVKSYYPGAEVVIRYATGDDQVVELVPPYTMSCFGQIFSPRAFAIPFGRIGGDVTPLNMGGNQPHLAVSDIVLDPSRAVREIELRCVSSETVFGIMGLTVLVQRPFTCAVKRR